MNVTVFNCMTKKKKVIFKFSKKICSLHNVLKSILKERSASPSGIVWVNASEQAVKVVLFSVVLHTKTPCSATLS